MKVLNFSTDDVNDYYNGHFAQDLREYFEIEEPCAHRDYSMVLYMDCVNGIEGNPTGNAIRVCHPFPLLSGSHDVLHNFVFAGIVLHMILISQSLRAVVGESAAGDFHRASGWPLFSAGMAGVDYDAMRMLEEASLAPSSEEVDNFKKMMQVVSPFMQGELRHFLNGETPANINAVAYQRLTNSVAGKVDEVMEWISRSIESFLSKR